MSVLALSLGGSTPGGEERPVAHGDTIYLTAADKDGNVVSLIQSIYEAFGAGIVAGDTGVVMNNRSGRGFSLDPAHVNVIAPGKRTYHTLAPGIVLRKDNSLMMTFGTPGSDGQTQTMLQVLNNIYLFGMAPQQAVDAPRAGRALGALQDRAQRGGHGLAGALRRPEPRL